MWTVNVISVNMTVIPELLCYERFSRATMPCLRLRNLEKGSYLVEKFVRICDGVLHKRTKSTYIHRFLIEEQISLEDFQV